MANTSILAAFERMWQHVVAALSNKSDTDHEHDDKYYTESEIDSKISSLNNANTYIATELDEKMNWINPTGVGSFSLNRMYNSTIGEDSVAEGNNTTASGVRSHAEGYYTTASGENSHAEGSSTIASGFASHAEGCYTTSSSSYSHAEGFFTTASSDYQHTQGKYNIEDSASTYAHIVGNGTAESARSNAHTLDWEGNAWFAGDIYLGGTGQDDSSAKKLSDLLAAKEGVLISIPTTGWSASAPYTIDISVDGVVANPSPIFYLIPAGDTATESELEAVKLIQDVTVNDGSVTVTVNEIPLIGFTIGLYGLTNDVEYSPADYSALSGRVSALEATINPGVFSFGIDDGGIYYVNTATNTGYAIGADTDGIFVETKGE